MVGLRLAAFLFSLCSAGPEVALCSVGTVSARFSSDLRTFCLLRVNAMIFIAPRASAAGHTCTESFWKVPLITPDYRGLLLHHLIQERCVCHWGETSCLRLHYAHLLYPNQLALLYRYEGQIVQIRYRYIFIVRYAFHQA